MSNEPIERVRRICLALPEVAEKVAWHEPTWRVRGKVFAMYASGENHHGAGRDAVWVAAPEGTQQMLTEVAPARYFVPPYVGKKGWVGIVLSECVDVELAVHVVNAYYMMAPQRLQVHEGEDAHGSE